MVYTPELQSAGGGSQGKREGLKIEPKNEHGPLSSFAFEREREDESLFEGLLHFPVCRPNPFPGFAKRRMQQVHI